MSIKSRYLWGRWVTIVLPLIFSLAFVLNTVLCYCDYNTAIIDNLCGLSVGSIIMMYLMHTMFGLCYRHRVMIDYLAVSTALSIYDSFIGIRVTDREILIIYMAIFGIFSIIYFFTAIR